MNLTLIDRTVIGTLGRTQAPRFTVLAARHEVALRDGSLHWFHRVLDFGVPSRFIRALQLDGGAAYAVFDLRAVHRGLGADIAICPERDVPGTITYNLREIYPTGPALRQKIGDEALANGTPAHVVTNEAEAA